MKKRFFTTVCFMIVLLVISPGFGAAGAQDMAVPTADMLRAYADVLSGNQSYIRYNRFDDVASEAVMTDEISQWYGYIFDLPLRFTAFCVTDLDADGNPELLLKLSEDFGFELLRYADGKVYGYPFFARGMEAVTMDGDIHGSSGAGNFGWYTVCFAADYQLETTDVCRQYDDLDEGVVYCIGDTKVTESEFTALNEELWGKDRLIWTAYTP